MGPKHDISKFTSILKVGSAMCFCSSFLRYKMESHFYFCKEFVYVVVGLAIKIAVKFCILETGYSVDVNCSFTFLLSGIILLIAALGAIDLLLITHILVLHSESSNY